MAYDNHNNGYSTCPVDPCNTFTDQNAAANLLWFVQPGRRWGYYSVFASMLKTVVQETSWPMGLLGAQPTAVSSVECGRFQTQHDTCLIQEESR